MSDIRIATDDHLMVLTLNRPEKRNALTDAMYGDIADALDAAAQDADVHVAMIAGEGSDFCAGNDIQMFAEANQAGSNLSGSNVAKFLSALSTFPKPLVAAVTGRAIGVGVTLLLHCDLVYVAEDADLRMPFIDLGLVPEAGSARLLPARIGHVRAFELFGLARPLDGRLAAGLGIANAALPSGEVAAAAEAAARTLARKPPAALAATKALMRDAEAIGVAIDAERDAFLERLASPEAAAAFAAFMTRKKPAPSSGA